MIPVNSRTLEEAEIIGGTAKLIEVDLWSPDKSEIKYIISAANYHHETFEEWEFPDEKKAREAFEDLSSKAIC
ncbi:hypothetical protein N9Y63_07210 [Akkermansiaceae bacterium]|nr:hypothetical protein [Akkermansiaceae bacterium]